MSRSNPTCDDVDSIRFLSKEDRQGQRKEVFPGTMDRDIGGHWQVKIVFLDG